MLRLMILMPLILASGSIFGQSNIVCGSTIHPLQPSFNYVAPAIAKSIIVDKHVDAAHVQGDQVIDALGIIATQAQQYQAMISGLQSLGFAGQQHCSQQSAACSPQQQQIYHQNSYPQAHQQPYVPFAQAPYQAGTTAYGVRNVQIDAFGPQDVREIMASVSRYSTQANSGANQLMGQANSLADRIAQSVAADADAALRVATIDAETRGAATTSQALIAMAQVMRDTLAVTKPQQQTRVSVQEQSGEPTYPRSLPDPLLPLPLPTDNATPDLALLVEHCAKCHGPDMAEPKGGFRLGPLSRVEADAVIQQVYEGTMPPNNPLPITTRGQLANEVMSLVSE